MAVYLDNLKYMKLYKKKFCLPINKKDKKHNSAILLLTPNYETSNYLMNYPLAINMSKSFQSYYIEKDIMYTINNENALQIDHIDNATGPINEQTVYTEVTNINSYEDKNDISINEFYCHMGDKIIFFNEMYDEEIYMEASNNNSKYKRLLYNDRIRNNKIVFDLYKKVKEDNDWIKYTFIDYKRYHSLNLFIDLYYYNQAYLNNNKFTITKSIDMYFEFIRRFINDKRIDNAGYTKKVVYVPVFGWEYDKDTVEVYNYLKVLNPISIFYKKIKFSPTDLQVFKDIDFVFMGKNGYFKFSYDDIVKKPDFNRFKRNINALVFNEAIDDSDEKNNSADAITSSIIDKLEKTKGIKIHNLTGDAASDDEEEELKAELVSKISDAAENAIDEDEALDRLDNSYDSEEVKRLISDLENNADDSIKLSATRLNRINKAQDEFMKKELNNKSIKQMVNDSNRVEELPEKNLPIKTINNEWHHLKAINFEKEYDLDADIVKCINSLSDPNKDCPVSILSIDKQDTSTSEDLVYTYTVKCEGFDGKRFTLKFDIPKFRDGRFMRLRGNDKIFTAEMPLLPISKTEDDTVQIVTLYNKIFIYRYYTSAGKSNPVSDRIIKAIGKCDSHTIKTLNGDNTIICKKYELPIDYIDLASQFSTIFVRLDSGEEITFYFNQDQIRAIKDVNVSKGIPIGISNKNGVLYYNAAETTLSECILDYLKMNKHFTEVYENTKAGKKYTYSRAKILNTYIPIIVIMAHGIGLTKALETANIKYDISDKKSNDDNIDSIKFKDGYLNYEMTYNSMMLMNGLKDCNTEDIEIASINSRVTWVEMLDNFGGRIKSDGLDNFKDLMFDPITVEVCHDYKLPDNYFAALAYANDLLADNKFIAQKDLSSNRYRTNEVVAAQFYKALSDSYKDYSLQNKHGRQVVMYMKQSAVIDLILESNTTSDLSIFQPLYEVETKNTVSFKGVGGMNLERGYSMEKRGYDASMINNLAQATGFAATVGINRQTTINPNITGGRGYFKPTSTDDINVVNTLSMTEALSPYTVSSDDPFRNAMTFVQTSKHTTPIENGSPLLVTTGADAAMPYLVSDMFCHKAKKKGTVKAITPEYLLIEYDDKTTEYVCLAERTLKNSDGGFYVSLKFKTDLKVGDRVKPDTIVAYDKKSFSKKIGDHSQLAYNLGCITKLAIMTTEDGFEDSGVCSEWLSEAMASDIVVSKDVDLPASANILSMCKIGDEVLEGEPILIYQNAYDEEDANLLLKSLNDEDGDVSELGRLTIRSKTSGVISDIKIYRTVEIDELSDSLKKIVVAKENQIKKLKKIADEASNDTYSIFDSTEKLPQNGKLKYLDGVRIEFFMKYHDKLGVGDKIVCNSANKMVLMDMYDEENAPYTDFRPTEKIDAISSASAIDGRMITSNFKLGLLYKLMIELSRKVDNIYGIKWKTIHEMYENEKKYN